MNDTDTDIFGEVADTEAPQTQADPNTQLYLIPEGLAAWFGAKREFDTPKDAKDCTTSLVVRFLSWKIAPENQSVYLGTGLAVPGTLRNQLVVRYHPVPDGYAGGAQSGKVPCRLQFEESCPWCEEKNKSDKRFPRDKQPPNYFRDVIAKFKAKDRTFMLFEVWEQDGDGNWTSDHKVRAVEFANYVKNGRTFAQIINDRANDADRRIRIDKKTYAGYTAATAIKITWNWPVKSGKPEHGQFATWTPTDATPFPVEAGGPDVMAGMSKEWAAGIASHDPASWINRNAFPTLKALEVGQWVYDVFTGKVSAAPAVDIDTADFGQLLAIIGQNKAKFDEVGVNPDDYDYTQEAALRDIVKGVLNG